MVGDLELQKETVTEDDSPPAPGHPDSRVRLPEDQHELQQGDGRLRGCHHRGQSGAQCWQLSTNTPQYQGKVQLPSLKYMLCKTNYCGKL